MHHDVPRFAHDRLDAYSVAREALVLGEGIAKMRADEAPRPGYQDRAPSHDIEWLACSDAARNWNKFRGDSPKERKAPQVRVARTRNPTNRLLHGDGARLCCPWGYCTLVQYLESVLVERCPDLLVVLDGDLKVVRASAGLRSAVPLVEPGTEFARSLEDPYPARLAQALALERDSGVAFNLDVMHRGRERLVPATYRFYALEKPFVAGLGREIAATEDLADQVDALRRRHQEMLSQLASMTGRLRELARNDSLTGLLNRRAFLDQGEHEWVRHKRHRHPIACFALDVDSFKNINDSFGHAAGDAVLQHIGTLLRATDRRRRVRGVDAGDHRRRRRRHRRASSRPHRGPSGHRVRSDLRDAHLHRSHRFGGLRQPGRVDGPRRPSALPREEGRQEPRLSRRADAVGQKKKLPGAFIRTGKPG